MSKLLAGKVFFEMRKFLSLFALYLELIASVSKWLFLTVIPIDDFVSNSFLQ